MTDLDTGPSSIRDDSICESSLPPNKSSGDIGERLRYLSSPAAEQLSDFQRINAFVQIGHESAAEIERLRREVEEANRFWNERCVQTSVNAHGWMQAHDQLLGFIQSRPGLLKVMMAEKPEIKYPAPADTPALLQRALTAESAVAAADLAFSTLQKCVQDVLDGDFGPRFASKHDQCPHKKFQWEDCGNCIDEHLSKGLTAASAIRAVVEKKTAESGHSPSTHNSESE